MSCDFSTTIIHDGHDNFKTYINNLEKLTLRTCGKDVSQSAAKYLVIFQVFPQSYDFSMYMAAGLKDLKVIIKWVT